MRILVTGSSGRIGGAIAARLSLRHQVTGLDLAAGPMTSVLGDIRDVRLLATICGGIDAVIHTASLHAPDLGIRSEQEFRDTNVEGTQRLLAACGEAGVSRFVYTSTTSLYGCALMPVSGEAVWVTEELQPEPRDIYDETKLSAEQACAEAARGGMTCISLRMSRCFPEHPRLVAIYRLYRGVDAADVAQAHELALAPGLSGFQVFNVSAHSPFTHAECGTLLADARTAVLAHHPWALPEFARRGWALPESIDRVYVVDKAIAGLGYRPAHDFKSLFR
ncbi:MAG: NAD(P)-dependent oxidoreductase [Gammaproteobacteria bacterium]|nr:NAD(P)-dependent oxidoreductase [Gammaproteobacteria bacterium]